MKKIVSFAIAMCLGATSVCAQYSDIDAHWAHSEINSWTNAEIINGNDGKFRPDDNITRGEIAAVINRILKYQTLSDINYTDVDNSMWFYEDVSKLSKVMTGDGVNFRPYDNITREEAVVLICKALKIEKQHIL